jgi:phosphoglycerate dehydrogenase-like enzyme
VYAPISHDPAPLARMKSCSREQLLQDSAAFPAAFCDSLPDTEILYTLVAPVDLLDRAPMLRWVANLGSGTEHYQAHGLQGSPVRLTSAKGVGARCIAEFAMSQLLALSRRWPERIRDQQERRWRWHGGRELSTMTLGIVGLGEIGRELARMAHAFGMRVIGIRRRSSEPVPYVQEVFAPHQLHEMLGQCDVAVISAAYTKDTAGSFDAKAIGAMRPGSFLVNVGRGGIVDETALVRALESSQLAGAAFDVFEQEPLPPASPLWSAPNLLVSAHEAVAASNYHAGSLQRFLDNLVRYRDVAPLLGEVDLQHGY